MDFQRRSWRLQRVGWGLIALAAAAAVLGLLGPGPLSRARAAAGDGLVVEYEQFVHSQAPTRLAVRFDAETASDGQVRLWLEREYVEGLKVREVTPEPERSEAGSDRVVYVMRLAAGARAGAAVFEVEPEAIGRLRGSLGIVGGRAVIIRQLVYP